MVRVELYVDREDKLTLDIYPSIKNENLMQQLKGKNCYEFIKELCSAEIKELSQSANKEDIRIRTNDFIFTINECNKVFQRNGTKVIRDTINNYVSKEKLKQIKPKKVTRKNKHNGKKIIAGVLAAMIIFFSVHTIAEGKQQEYSNLTSTYYSETIGFNNIETENIEQNEEVSSEETLTEEVTEFSPDTTFVSLDYEDRSDSEKAQITRAYYSDAIKKYAEIYGVDYELMLAIATQERGVHSETRDSGGAIGLFQIENIWNNQELTAYNYETNEYETITVDENRLSDVFYNIKVGCMVFQTALRYMDYNIPAAIQCYNMGYGNMQKILTACSNATGKSISEILSEQTNLDWLRYRNQAIGGDKNYLEHVSSYMAQNTEININNGEEEINMNINRKI